MGELTYIGPVKQGRPPEHPYSKEAAEEICHMLEDGLSLSVICAHEDAPSRRTVYRWLSEHEEFRANYARARARQADTFADQIQDIADNLFIPAAMKAQMIDARKWRAARQNWRAWGDKVTHEHEVTVHPSVTAREVPAGIGWIAGQLQQGEPAERPEPGVGGVGEE